MATNNQINIGLSGTTGTGSFVGSTSPSLTTPTLGAATATSINFGGSTLSTYVATTSWTPTFTFATAGNLSVAYGGQTGTYVQIGSILFFNFILTFTPTYTTASGSARITGFPVTSSGTSFFTILNASSFAYPGTNTYLVGTLNGGTSLATILSIGTNSAGGVITTSALLTGVQQTFEGSGFYFV